MADAAQIVEGMGADIVDVNMGCPVPKIAKHNAGCSLMREPAHGGERGAGDGARGEDSGHRQDARGVGRERHQRAGSGAGEWKTPGRGALAVHGRTAAQSYSGVSDWELIATVAAGVSIPVFGSGDCVEPGQVVERLRGGEVGGVLVGRGALRNPWIFEQAADVAAGRAPREISAIERGEFLLQYVDMLLTERLGEADGFRHVAPGQSASAGAPVPARGHDRWVINKLRALNSWYTKGLDNGSHLRVAINAADSVAELRAIIEDFFFVGKSETAEVTEIAEVI